MLKTFVIVATLFAPGYAPQYYVLDSGLSGSDCIEFISAMSELPAIEIAPGHIANARYLTIACQIDRGE